MCWWTAEDGWQISSTACVKICWRWVHWQRRVGYLGSQGSYLMARKPPWDGNRLGWGSILPRVSAQSTWWMDTAECWGMVGQRKLYSVVTGKRNMSRVSPGLG